MAGNVNAPAAACSGGTLTAIDEAAAAAEAVRSMPPKTSWLRMGLPVSSQVSKRRCPEGPPRRTAGSLAAKHEDFS